MAQNFFKKDLTYLASGLGINPVRVDAVLNTFSNSYIHNILNRYGANMIGILIVMAEKQLPIDFSVQVTLADGNCYMHGLENQTFENTAVKPHLTREQVMELRRDKKQLRKIWCQSGKGYFAGKWGSKVNYKGDMLDKEWEEDWRKQSQDGVYTGTFLASDLFIMVPPHLLKRHILVIDANQEPAIKLLDANIFHNNEVPDLNPFILAHTENHYQSMVPTPGSEEYWRELVGDLAEINRTSAVVSNSNNNVPDLDSTSSSKKTSNLEPLVSTTNIDTRDNNNVQEVECDRDVENENGWKVVGKRNKSSKSFSPPRPSTSKKSTNKTSIDHCDVCNSDYKSIEDHFKKSATCKKNNKKVYTTESKSTRKMRKQNVNNIKGNETSKEKLTKNKLDKGKNNQTVDDDNAKENNCNMIQVTRNLRLRNNTGRPYETNLCFSNVITNILDRIDPLKEFFASNVWKYRSNEKVPILSELDFIFKAKQNQEASTGELRKLVATVSKKEYLGNGEQQDAVEYLATILDLLQEEFIKLGFDNFIRNNFQSSEIIKKRFISSEGNGACPNCHTLPDERTDKKIVFSLPLPEGARGSISLENLIKEYYTEKLQPPMRCTKCCPDHGVKCDSSSICNKVFDYTEKREIEQNADYLLIQLMRFNNAEQKLGVTVIPEDILTLPGRDGSDGDKYQIVSIVDHQGDNMRSGHYVIQTISNNSWITLEDDKRPKNKGCQNQRRIMYIYTRK